MKTTLLALLLTSALAAPALAGSGTAFSHPVTRVVRDESETITRGSAMPEVLAALGSPLRKLSPSVWVYARYHGGDAQPRTDRCSLLIVAFNKSGAVTDLQLVNREAEAIIAARINHREAPVGLFAAK